MSALNKICGFVVALLVCLSVAGLPVAYAGPALAQTETNLGASRATEVLQAPSSQPSAEGANVGNPAPASGTERRVALVIGNSAYESVTALPNPANDAKAIGQFLNSAGFEVILATDLDHDEMIQVLQDFSAKIAERGPNTVAFVYYAGHGLQIAGDNYLVPIDARISSETDVPNTSIRLVDVMATLQAVPSRMRIVVLDACRNNPFTQLKDTGRGLAIVDSPNGSIVGYSTAPGTEAFDGEGKNSPYTSAFLRLGREANLPIEQFFKKVRVAVNDATEGKQTPWESSSLTSDFYFFGDTAVAAAKMTAPVQSANASATRPTLVASNVRSRSPREAYNYVIAEDSVEYYQEFVRVYPSDPYADHIRRVLAAKLLAVAWHGAVIANSAVGYKSFYSQYSDSPYANLALKLQSQPKVMPLYQPTKIMIAPQIAPKVSLTNFNGVNVPQGNNAPIGLGNTGSLFNKKVLTSPAQGLGQSPQLPGKATPGFPSSATTGIAGGVKTTSIPNGNPISVPANGGQSVTLPNGGQVKPSTPGVDLAKGVKRIDKLDTNRVTTLPNNGKSVNGMPVTTDTPNGNAAPIVNKDAKVTAGKGVPSNRIVTPAGNPVGRTQATGQTTFVKPLNAPRVTNTPVGPAIRTAPVVKQTATVKPFQPAPRVMNNGGNTRMQFRSNSRPMTVGSSGGRFAGGGASFGRAFR